MKIMEEINKSIKDIEDKRFALDLELVKLYEQRQGVCSHARAWMSREPYAETRNGHRLQWGIVVCPVCNKEWSGDWFFEREGRTHVWMHGTPSHALGEMREDHLQRIAKGASDGA